MSSSPLRDEILTFDPEPCDTCDIGISKFRCYDNLRRCQACITALAIEKGWNEY